MRLLLTTLLPALIAAGPAAVPSPAPSSAPLRTIEQLHVSPACASLHRMAEPFARAVENNQQRFAAIERHAAAMYEWQAAGAADGPALTLNAAGIDQLAAQSYDDLTLADSALERSYRQMPQGSDPAFDSLRSRMQTIVDLERVMTDRYESLAGAAGTQAGPKLTSYRFLRAAGDEVRRDAASAPAQNALEDPQLGSPIAAVLRSLRERLIPLELAAAARCGIL